MGSARVLRDVAADRAHLLARRIGRVEVAVVGDRPRDVEVRDAGLDDDALAREVDLEDPVEARDRDDDPVRDWERATREAGPRAAGDERDAVARAETHHRLHLLGRARKHDARRLGAPARQPVAVVGRELLGLGDDVLVAERVPEVADELRSERHDGDPTPARFDNIDHR